MASFLQLLLKNAAPRLGAMNYRSSGSMLYIGNQLYDDNLRYGHISDKEAVYFCFHKRLSSGRYAFIVFQREQTSQMTANGNRFTVYLMRHKPVSIGKWFLVKNATSFDIPKTNIGSILHHVFHLDGVSSENWWNPHSEVEMLEYLDRVVYYLENHGIPWIEDLSSRSIDLSFSEERTAFNRIIHTILQDKMSDNGYILKQSSDNNTIYFTKRLSSERNVHIVFGFGFDVNGRQNFDVLLYRTKSENPFDYSQSDEDVDYLVSSLGFILQKSYKIDVKQILNLMHTRYDTKDQLFLILNGIYPLIIEYGIPWIEQANTNY